MNWMKIGKVPQILVCDHVPMAKLEHSWQPIPRQTIKTLQM